MELSRVEARRLALGAQGFASRPAAKPGVSHVRRIASRLGAIQIDSVNVLVRAHYMPAYSRLGPYPRDALDSLAHKKRELFEYWGHAACFIPMASYPLLRWRMERHERLLRSLTPDVKRYVKSVYSALAGGGPLAASELPNAGRSSGPWWGWSDGKRAVEALLRAGRVAVAGRRNFERLYDVPQRVIPKEVLSAAAPSPDDARKELLLKATRAIGVGTAKDIAAYFHLDGWWERPSVNGKRAQTDVPHLIVELVEDARILPVRVDGWKQTGYTVPGVRIPKTIDARSLISPFDPLMWERRFTKSLFDFDYKIEIYVPEPKRQFGYYTLPFLLGEDLVARIDLKADRKRSVLLVPGAFAEAGRNAKHVANELGAELRRLAGWLGLESIEVGERGELAKPLARAVKAVR